MRSEQEQLRQEYERQQTPAGQSALQVRRGLLKKFRNITGTTDVERGEVKALRDARTGKIQRYFTVR